MGSFKRSLALSVAQRNASLLIQFVSSLLIARLLTPHEIGIFSIGAVIVSFSHIVRDVGVSNYVVQERELTTERLRSAQAIVWISSLSLAFLVAVFSVWAGWFYAEPGVELTMQVLAINFLLLPIGVVTVALLTREMAFGQLFVVNIAAALAQALTGVLLAWAGFGFISLAWSAVAGGIVSALGSLICRRPEQPWLPGIREWRRVFAAGSKLGSTSLLYEIGLAGPELIAGRALGFEAVAYFSRGLGVGTMVLRSLVDSMSSVAVSYFARQSRSAQDLKAPYLRGVSYMSILALPAFACLATMAEPVILFLYGRQWLEAVMPLQIVSVGLTCLAVTNVAGAVLVGSGQLGTQLRMHAICQPLKILAVLVGVSFFGLAGVAAGVAIGDVSVSLYGLYMANRLLGVSLGEITRAVLPSAAVALGAALLAAGTLRALVPGEPVVIQVALAGLAAGIGWLLGLILTRHPMWDELRGLFRRMN